MALLLFRRHVMQASDDPKRQDPVSTVNSTNRVNPVNPQNPVNPLNHVNPVKPVNSVVHFAPSSEPEEAGYGHGV
jgi:hypothetical protein